MTPPPKQQRITFGRLTNLLLGNFKAFKRMQRIPIRPITLIYGKNNSGKSSIIQALLYAESVRRNKDLNPASIEKNGVVVADGGFDRLFYGRDGKRHLEFGWEWENPNSNVGLNKGTIQHKIHGTDLALNASLNDEDYMTLDTSEESHFHLNKKHRDLQLALATLQKWFAHELHLDNPLPQTIRAETIRQLEAGCFSSAIINELLGLGDRGLAILKLGLPPSFRYCPQVEEDFSNRSPWRSGYRLPLGFGVDLLNACFKETPCEPDLMMFLWGLKQDTESHVRAFIEERCAYLFYHWIEDVWAHFSEPLRRLVDTMHYLPSVRSRPDTLVVREPQDLEEGLGKPAASLSQKHRDWIWQKATFDKANRWLRKHRSLVGNVEIKHDEIPSADGKTAARLTLCDRSRRVSLDLKEVGFGLSQFIPVLLASFAEQDYASYDGAGTLIVEEPEAHVHPALQSEIGDLFIEAVGRKQRPLSNVICETHSEHILLRIMRRIREGKLHPSKVSVLYVENLGKESLVRTMPLDKEGKLIRDWPGGFFEEGLREVLF